MQPDSVVTKSVKYIKKVCRPKNADENSDDEDDMVSCYSY